MKAPRGRLSTAVWRMPIRLKVAIWTSMLVGIIQLFVATGVIWHLYDEGLEEVDKNIGHAAHNFFREVTSRKSAIDWDNPAEVERLFSADGEPYFAEISDASGRSLHRSRLMERADLGEVRADGVPVTLRVRSKPIRLAAFELDGLKLIIGVNAHMVFETREDLIRTSLFTCPLVLVLVGLSGWWVAGRALAPVAQVTAAAEAITAERLDQRLPTPPAGDEIGRLTAVLNKMIERLEASLHQARRFSADASHELRTPLTILRGEIESALRAPNLGAAQERLLLNLLEEVNGLSRITAGLLLLSRADAGRLSLDRKQVDLSHLIEDLIGDIEILAASNEVQVETHLNENVIVEGHEPFLRQLVLNVLDNALKYNRPAGRIRVDLTSTESEVVLLVGNTGGGVKPEQGAQLFERFYRGEVAEDTHGHGLGLSICREIVRAHDGEITLSKAESDWTEFRIVLPATSSAARMNAV